MEYIHRISLCNGNQATLNASGAQSYIWDNGISNGISFVPLSTTTYTVIGTDLNGCENTDSLELTILSLPQVEAGIDLSVCTGDSIILNGTGALTFSWDNGVSNGISFSPPSTAYY